MPLFILLSFILAAAGASLVYAGSRNQVLIPAHSAHNGLRLAGFIALIISLVIMLQWFGPAAAAFIWLTVAMLIWSIVPFAAVWWRNKRDSSQ